MNKTLKVFNAMLSEDMQMFRYKNKSNSSKLKKILLPFCLFVIVSMAIGFYAYELADALSKVHLTYIMLTIFLLFTSMISFIQAIYKSQGILFEGKDNDLLFSLPINKSVIFSLRVVKLLYYQFIYSLMYILPAFIIYAYIENPGFSFYLVSIVMIILLTIIPTLIGTIFGYFVKAVSSKSKSKKLIQSILTTVIFFGIWLFFMRFQNFTEDIVKNATSINDVINKVYYPIGLYISLITKFNIMDFIKLLLINIIPFVFVVRMGSIFYFNVVSSSSKSVVNRKSKNKSINYKKQNVVISLVKKDLVRYITSPTYVMNTMFALLIILVLTISLCVNPNKLVDTLVESGISTGITFDKIVNYLPCLYAILIIFASVTTSITSSCISIEGKTFSITKSLPVSTSKIFLSKVLFGNLVAIPIIFLSTIIFIVKFKVSVIFSIILLLLAIFAPILSSLFGLFINLLFPKMNTSSDAEVVKQSMASMIAVWGGMIIAVISSLPIAYNLDSDNLVMITMLELFIIVVIDILLIILLQIYGKKLYSNIEC